MYIYWGKRWASVASVLHPYVPINLLLKEEDDEEASVVPIMCPTWSMRMFVTINDSAVLLLFLLLS